MSVPGEGSAARPATLGLSTLPGGRVPPQNLDAERSLLGGVLLDNQALDDVLEIVKPEDFYRETHRRIFESMQALAARSEPIDRITVKNELTQQGVFAAVGGDDFIDLLDKLVPSASNLAYYAQIVRDKAIQRRLIEAAHAIAAAGYEQQGAVGEFVDEAERKIFAITEEKAQTAFTPVKEVVKSAFKLIQQLYERQEVITGFATGFADLDNLTSGFQPGDLVVLAARPSMGKTAFCLNIATHVGCRAKFNGKKCGVAIFSLEMPKEQLVMRMLASEARVDAQRLRTGRLIESDWGKLAHAAGVLADANIHIDDSPALSALELRAKSRRLASKFSMSEAPLGLIVIDYLQLMRGNERIESREQQISEISRSLKGLAKELKVPVLALSQLNRSLEKRPDKRPQLSDLRECVAGDTLVCLEDGRRVAIRELVGTAPRLLAMHEGRIVKATSDKVWSVGKKQVLELRLASGRRMRATGKHRFYAARGWTELRDLRPGDRVALGRQFPEPDQCEEWPEARHVLLAHLIGDGSYVDRLPTALFRLGRAQVSLFLRHLWATAGRISLKRQGGGIFFSTCSRGLADDVAFLLLRVGIVGRIRTLMERGRRPLFSVHVSGHADQARFLDSVGAVGARTPAAFAPSLEVSRSASASPLRNPAPQPLAEPDLFWDRILSVEPCGEEEVFDLTVPGPASWLADGIVSHNSGAIEQDADTICFIYREEVYEKEKQEVKGIAEIIVGKQRNGPIGTTTVAFLHEFTRFENLARDYTPGGGSD